MTDRFTDARVPDPGVRVLFAKQHRWQCWLEVEAALAVAEAECGVIPAAAAEAIESAARLAALDVTRIERGIAESSHPLMALVTELSTAAGEHGGWGGAGVHRDDRRRGGHLRLYDAARVEDATFADALKRDPRVTAHLDATAIDRLLDPAGHTGLSAGIARAAAGRARATARDITAAGSHET